MFTCRVLALLVSFIWHAVTQSSPVHMCCRGQRLRFGLDPTVDMPPLLSHRDGNFSGFLIDELAAVAADMGITPVIVPAALLAHEESLAASYTTAYFDEFQLDLTLALSSDPLTFVCARRLNLSVTPTLVDGYFQVATLREKRPKGAFRFMAPFCPELWIAFFVMFVVSSTLLVVINTIAPNEDLAELEVRERISVNLVTLSCYHIGAFLFSGEEYEWTTWPSRMLRLGMLVILLVSTASYTANLAAFFTAPDFKILGPRDMMHLQSASACTTWSLSVPAAENFVASLVTPPAHLERVQEREDWCIQKLKSREVDVFISSVFEMRLAVKRYCSTLALNPNIKFGSLAPGILVRSSHIPMEFVRNMSAAIVHHKSTPEFADALSDQFLVGTTLGECDRHALLTDTTPLSLESQRGLFYSFMLMAGAALLFAVVQALLRRWTRNKISPEGDNVSAIQQKPEYTMTDGELLRLLLKKVDTLGTFVEALERGESSKPTAEESFEVEDLTNSAPEESIQDDLKMATVTAVVPCCNKSGQKSAKSS
eukprot:TRINITY_DN113808_c0_g1_i1.p1 TRINITY_DN113808_c0_g1~~TRINITY_DN113808_c0_g1_i1.p1  ORF type:complete len:540 (+),score=67.43 TRINITY_DN113808_c0_g1_i1:22-1641(+)